eukprot:652697-Hanusia_phi.AAC.1
MASSSNSLSHAAHARGCRRVTYRHPTEPTAILPPAPSSAYIARRNLTRGPGTGVTGPGNDKAGLVLFPSPAQLYTRSSPSGSPGKHTYPHLSNNVNKNSKSQVLWMNFKGQASS